MPCPGHDPNTVCLQILLLLRGIAVGLTFMPVIAVAYSTVDRSQLPDATSLVNIVQRVGGSIGSALLAIVLYRSIAGGMSSADAFTWQTVASVVAAVASVWLVRTPAKQR